MSFYTTVFEDRRVIARCVLFNGSHVMLLFLLHRGGSKSFCRLCRGLIHTSFCGRRRYLLTYEENGTVQQKVAVVICAGPKCVGEQSEGKGGHQGRPFQLIWLWRPQLQYPLCTI